MLQLVGSVWTLYDWRVSTGVNGTFDTAQYVQTTINSSTQSTVNYGTGAGATTKVKTYALVNSQSELTAVQWGSAPSTTYSYYTGSTGTGWAQAVQSTTDPTGNWTHYDYFNGATDTRAGQIQHKYRPWLDAPAAPSSATTTNCYLETYDYVLNYDGSTTAPASRIVTILGTTAAKTTWAYNWDYETINSHFIAQIQESDYSSSGSSLTTTTLAYIPNDFDP